MPDLLCKIMHTCNLLKMSKNLVKILRSYVRFLQEIQGKASSWFQILASSYCDDHARSHVKIVVRSLARLFKNLAIEPCKILARIRQDLGSNT